MAEPQVATPVQFFDGKNRSTTSVPTREDLVADALGAQASRSMVLTRQEGKQDDEGMMQVDEGKITKPVHPADRAPRPRHGDSVVGDHEAPKPKPEPDLPPAAQVEEPTTDPEPATINPDTGDDDSGLPF